MRLSHIAAQPPSVHDVGKCALADIYPASRQREALLKLVEALGCWDRALKRDECGDPRIVGKLGHIYAVPGTLDRPKAEGFLIYFRGAPEYEEPTDSQAWTWAKKLLEPFCQVTQDGDTEGILFLDRLPTKKEAEAIRDKLVIRKRVEYDEETLARKREAILMARGSLPPKPPTDDDVG
jgi:hypothetical protein